jgi:hypothetical protein
MLRKPGAAAPLIALACFSVAVVTTAKPAAALTINPIFDSSVTSLSNASLIESVFNEAAGAYDTAFSDQVTINIGVSWGKVGSYALPSNAVGASTDTLYGYFSYGQISSWLGAGNTSPVLAQALSNVPANSAARSMQYVLPSAQAKALGLISGNSAGIDGYIGFAGSSTTGYSFSPLVTNPGTFNLVSVAEHEIAEVLGRISGVTSSDATYLTPFDLLRYSAPGQNDYSGSDLEYLSIDGGVTAAGTFNNSSQGGDRSDWLTTSTSKDASDAFISPGQTKALSRNDLNAIAALGYNGTGVSTLALPNTSARINAIRADELLPVGPDGQPLADPVPEPASILALLAGLGGLALFRRRGGSLRAA